VTNFDQESRPFARQNIGGDSQVSHSGRSVFELGFQVLFRKYGAEDGVSIAGLGVRSFRVPAEELLGGPRFRVSVRRGHINVLEQVGQSRSSYWVMVVADRDSNRSASAGLGEICSYCFWFRRVLPKLPISSSLAMMKNRLKGQKTRSRRFLLLCHRSSLCNQERPK
jgi:hypothetical protein